MNKKRSTAEWFFLGFGVITVISGILLTVEGDYVSGVCGSIVGVFIIYLNVQKHKSLNEPG